MTGPWGVVWLLTTQRKKNHLMQILDCQLAWPFAAPRGGVKLSRSRSRPYAGAGHFAAPPRVGGHLGPPGGRPVPRGRRARLLPGGAEQM